MGIQQPCRPPFWSVGTLREGPIEVPPPIDDLAPTTQTPATCLMEAKLDTSGLDPDDSEDEWGWEKHAVLQSKVGGIQGISAEPTEVRRSSRNISKTSAPVSCNSSQGSKRRAESGSLTGSQKRQKTKAAEKGGSADPPKSRAVPKDVQVAIYGGERLSSSISISHSINLLFTGMSSAPWHSLLINKSRITDRISSENMVF